MGAAVAIGTITASSVKSSTDIFVDGIPIWWQSSDASILSAALFTTYPLGSATTSSTAIASTPSSQVTLNLPTQTSPSAPLTKSGGLSTGAKVAIGVVIPLVALFALAGLLYYARMRRSHKAIPSSLEGSPPTENKPDMAQSHELSAVERNTNAYELLALNGDTNAIMEHRAKDHGTGREDSFSHELAS